MRWFTGVLFAALLAAGCGSSTVPPAVPSAVSLAAKLGCHVLAQGSFFAGYDVKQDLQLDGTAPGCLGAEVWTFASAKAETDWLHQAQASSAQASTTIYPWMVTGTLWAASPGPDASALGRFARLLGGRQVSFS